MEHTAGGFPKHQQREQNKKIQNHNFENKFIVGTGGDGCGKKQIFNNKR